MTDKPLTIAVTGLNATDNPGPGVGVLRSLGLDGQKHRLVGLAYDALDPGVYTEGLASDVFLIPYPSQGLDAFFSRLEYVHDKVDLEVIIPTLDAELPSFIDLEPRLRAMGIGLFLPTRAQLDLRSKARLADLGRKNDITVPATAVVSNVEDLGRVHERVPYPFFVKGVFYGATLASTYEEAVHAFHKVVAQWGLPVIVQATVRGDELNVVGVGDGEGGIVGAVAMKKTVITDKGKGWAGITVRDPALADMTASFVRATSWRGPFEVEAIRDAAGRHHLIEVNPRFPAWVFLSCAAGMNLPRAVANLAAGRPAPVFGDYKVGTMFVRIALDQIASFADFQQMVTLGEVARTATGEEP